ncbi:MAG: hypothetical protein FWC70_03890 [Defluviitaleaceae bacterium]|nr:hypothetical protein [Defluviitaleaceae bacterium]
MLNNLKKVITAGFAILILTGATGCFLDSRPFPTGELFLAVRERVETYGESLVTLEELTDFEWCRALYFRRPSATTEDIESALGISFDRPMDLVGGMIFVHNDELVYYEIFFDTFLDTSDPRRRFFVHVPTTRVQLLEHDDLFSVGRRDGLYWLSWRE